MSAADDPQAFFDKHSVSLQEAAARSPGEAVAFIDAFTDDIERRVLFYFARRALVMEDWPGKNLDACVAVAEAGIAEMLRQASTAITDEARRRCLNLANAMSYDLAADTADCWPGDHLPRTRAHFEAGRAAAERCIGWREQMKSGDSSLATAWWAKGMHQVSLGDLDGARSSFDRSLEHARAAARDEGKPDQVGLDGEFGVILAWGYLGLTQWIAGDEQGPLRYGEAISTFNAQCVDPDFEEEARFGLEQLETVRMKYVRV